MSVRLQALPVAAITNVTALVGRDMEAQRCDIHMADGLITRPTRRPTRRQPAA